MLQGRSERGDLLPAPGNLRHHIALRNRQHHREEPPEPGARKDDDAKEHRVLLQHRPEIALRRRYDDDLVCQAVDLHLAPLLAPPGLHHLDETGVQEVLDVVGGGGDRDRHRPGDLRRRQRPAAEGLNDRVRRLARHRPGDPLCPLIARLDNNNTVSHGVLQGSGCDRARARDRAGTYPVPHPAQGSACRRPSRR
ncbi:hypothetical protein DSECCO2_437440 [anaerobic digester metagenome]